MMKFLMIVLMLLWTYKSMNNFYSNILMFLIMLLLFNYFNLNMYWNLISFNFGLNFYSFMLIILSLWIFNLILLMDLDYFCSILNLMLLMVLLLIFLTMNLLVFYFMFEVSLIIMFIIILKWGMGNLRLLASYYFMFYTLFFSFPLLIYLFLNIYQKNLLVMNLMEMMIFNMNMYMCMYMFMSFFVKIPMFMCHGWLLKAHVEAPVFGSMILASILLKLGTYGLLRMLMIFFNNIMNNMNLIILMFSLSGSLIISLVCLRQIDMKILVAYSSVVHMGMLLSSMMTFMKLGLIGSYIMMIGHGLCSSGLFYLVNLCYNNTGSRLMIINKGMMMFMPSMTLFWFMFCSSNMSAPISLNLIGEIFMLLTLILWFKFLFYILMLICFFSFSYSLYLFIYVQHGKLNFYLWINNNKIFDYYILLMHWIPLNIMFLNLIMFI